MELNPQKSIFNYLKNQLTEHNGFKEFGPNSLIFEDGSDKILVYINSCNLVIVHDGPNVDHGIEMIQIVGVRDLDEDDINTMYLQPILDRF
jgi:hypothetical protein